MNVLLLCSIATTATIIFGQEEWDSRWFLPFFLEKLKMK
jgi:hypothetical protein